MPASKFLKFIALTGILIVFSDLKRSGLLVNKSALNKFITVWYFLNKMM